MIKPCACGAVPVRCLGLVGYCAAHAPIVAVPVDLRQADPQPRAEPLYEVERMSLEDRGLGAIGATVLYTLGHGPRAGQQRPAIVMEYLNGEGPDARLLRVFCRSNDGLVDHEAGARYSRTPLAWHWSLLS